MIPATTNQYSFDGNHRAIKWRVSLKVSHNGVIVGDIYLYHKFPDGFMRRLDPTSGIYFWHKSTYPSWFTDQLTTVKIRNAMFPAPRDPHILLRHWYGPTWVVPIKAIAQGGSGDETSDYYGGATNMKLKTLTDHLKNKYGIMLKPVINVPIKWIFTYDQKQWVHENEVYMR